ncbi:putative zinc-binding phosphatase [Monocercomonoides exilis]|uniref:putative zinc-binding phosphatase n=1 Tax=Monocercomonoides exilis TaxID=2049356 RepID=UPI003559FA33|nr:putative zinc-binding phosphatase [Monocercomonoides exilis]|eukprot:MONOS_14955.1-p1 / transcript=MONOS_14955.1 / gene=MONOS_14955 / organism=Monocercomonoides_exilis_PA203 / gene_product=putative zinc-binding phosphatase / transcript_product=putative zinc-binding phosphatase / location=Mono_scaffold01114:10567-11085(+) / protein_length=146 / sequence_SO=supercontig / SO=protein_coding / is_pseudo=false
MRTCMCSMRAACVAWAQREIDAEVFYALLQLSRWLENIQVLLLSALELAQAVQGGWNVLAHCADGWDRTLTITSLAFLLLDPFSRTIAGFSTLVKKERMHFGYQFVTRAGGGRTGEHCNNGSGNTADGGGGSGGGGGLKGNTSKIM